MRSCRAKKIFYSELLLIIYYYPHLNKYLMWNIFKLKQGVTQGQKGSEEDADAVLRLLRLKFQKKMKEVSQNIAQSQNYFMSFSELPPRQQELIATFQQMLQTLEGLISIIGELREEINHQQGEINELVRARNMVANHHDIVNNLQQMYSQQIRIISERHEKDIQSAFEGKDDLERKIIQMARDKEQSQEKEKKMKEKVRALEEEIEDLKGQNSSLSSQLQELSLKSGRLLESNEKKKVINWQSLKLQYLFYYSKLKQGVIQFLDLNDYLRLKRVNRYFRGILQKGEGKFIHYMAKRQFEQKEKQAIERGKNYQRILQSFPPQNIKFNAIKYLYFRIKPASYIVSYLQEEVQSETVVQESKDKGKFNWRSLFAGEKHKKQEQNKFSLAQLKKEQQFKKVEGRIQSAFKHILPFKLPEDLTYFSETMQRQLSQLKESLVGKGPKGTQNTWIAEFHCLCRFMYLEVNQLYGLLQVLFAELLAKTRSLSQVQEEVDELRGNEMTLRNLIEDLSREKGNLERKSFLFESQVLKKSLQKDALASNLECLSIQLTNLRSQHQILSNDNSMLRKSQQQLVQDRKNWQTGLNRIKKELQELEQPIQIRRRRFSSGNGEEDFEQKTGIQKF